MFRRAVAVLLLRWVLIWAAAPLSAAEIRHITILHTNDLHARLQPLNEKNGGSRKSLPLFTVKPAMGTASI